MSKKAAANATKPVTDPAGPALQAQYALSIDKIRPEAYNVGYIG